jgi:serine/threonine-protein phosphatase 2A activator
MEPTTVAPWAKNLAPSAAALAPANPSRLQRRIRTAADLPAWDASPGKRAILSLITDCCEAVRGKVVSDFPAGSLPAGVGGFVAAVERMSGWVDEIPPVAQPSRFGNRAFRTWLARVRENREPLAREALRGLAGVAPDGVVDELGGYLLEAFGNETRIDYGSGHELAFVCALACAREAGAIGPGDLGAVGLGAFPAYLALCRKLQRVYVLEPAGSHGVWGLDDFHFVPYILGAAQLAGCADPAFGPGAIHDAGLREAHRREYLYMACIANIHEVKRGPFFEHSMVLNDISKVPSWDKIVAGLVKMYLAEVLAKVPIVQHVLFGELVRWE